MTDEVCDPLVSEALALLIRLDRERTAVEQAWAEVTRLRERWPGRFINLVWEHETYLDKIHYDILIEHTGGTLSLSYCADDDVPWPTRGLQRIKESLVVRVNGEPVDIAQVVTTLDYAWRDLHVGPHLIKMSLIDQEIRSRKIVASDDQLEAALAGFRVERRLFTAAAVERWMADHGFTMPQLEQHLQHQATRDLLRRQVVGGADECAAYFAAHRADFDRIQVAKIHVADHASAEALHRELRDAPQRYLAVAQQRFLAGAIPGETFITLWRDELEADQASLLFETETGQLAPLLRSGDGFEVALVLRRRPATLDDETQHRIAERMFERWLDDLAARARVEWFWGAIDAAAVPARTL